NFDGHALILYIPLFILLFFIARHSFAETQSAPFSIKDALVPFLQNRRSLLLLYFTQVANFTLMTAFIFLLPDLMRVKECHSWLCMGGGHLSFILCSALTMVPAGSLCDKYGHKFVLLT